MTLSDNLWLSEIVNDRIARPSATDELLVFHYRPTPCANFQCVALPSYPSWKCVASDTNISACLVCNLRRQNKLYQRTGLYWSWVVPIMKKERKALYTTECLVGFHTLLLQSAAARLVTVHAFTRYWLRYWNKMSASVCTVQRNAALGSHQSYRHIYQSIGYTLDNNNFTLRCKQAVT